MIILLVDANSSAKIGQASKFLLNEFSTTFPGEEVGMIGLNLELLYQSADAGGDGDIDMGIKYTAYKHKLGKEAQKPPVSAFLVQPTLDSSIVLSALDDIISGHSDEEEDSYDNGCDLVDAWKLLDSFLHELMWKYSCSSELTKMMAPSVDILVLSDGPALFPMKMKMKNCSDAAADQDRKQISISGDGDGYQSLLPTLPLPHRVHAITTATATVRTSDDIEGKTKHTHTHITLKQLSEAAWHQPFLSNGKRRIFPGAHVELDGEGWKNTLRKQLFAPYFTPFVGKLACFGYSGEFSLTPEPYLWSEKALNFAQLFREFGKMEILGFLDKSLVAGVPSMRQCIVLDSKYDTMKQNRVLDGVVDLTMPVQAPTLRMLLHGVLESNNLAALTVLKAKARAKAKAKAAEEDMDIDMDVCGSGVSKTKKRRKIDTFASPPSETQAEEEAHVYGILYPMMPQISSKATTLTSASTSWSASASTSASPQSVLGLSILSLPPNGRGNEGKGEGEGEGEIHFRDVDSSTPWLGDIRDLDTLFESIHGDLSVSVSVQIPSGDEGESGSGSESGGLYPSPFSPARQWESLVSRSRSFYRTKYGMNIPDGKLPPNLNGLHGELPFSKYPDSEYEYENEKERDHPSYLPSKAGKGTGKGKRFTWPLDFDESTIKTKLMRISRMGQVLSSDISIEKISPLDSEWRKLASLARLYDCPDLIDHARSLLLQVSDNQLYTNLIKSMTTSS